MTARVSHPVDGRRPPIAERSSGAFDLLDERGQLLVEALADRIAERQAPAPLLDAAAAGALLNVPASWVLAEARAGRMPAVRMGKYVRFRSDDIAAWLDRRVSR